MAPDYPEEPLLANNQLIIQEVLGSEVTHIKIQNLTIEEDFATKTSNVVCQLRISEHKEKEIIITGAGKGMVDALFNAFLNYFSDKYISLRAIQLYDFVVKVELKRARNCLNSDAPVEVKIALKGDGILKLYFKAKTDSLMRSSAQAVVDAVEYLINAEKAAVRLSKDAKSARKRKRMDLENSYICKLLELIKFISYSEAIEALDKQKG